MATRKKTETTRMATAGRTSADIQDVVTRLVRVLMLLGVEREEIVRTVRSTKRIALPKAVKIVPGPLVRWAFALSRWADDPRFTDAEGRPKDLPFSGKEPNFSQIVQLELPDEDPRICCEVLVATNSIVKLPSGKLRWLQREASTQLDSSGTIFADEFLNPIRALLSNSEVNLTKRTSKSNDLSFQRSVGGFALSQKDVVELRGFIDRHGREFLEILDHWLAQRTVKEKEGVHGSRLVSPYIGLFMTANSALPQGQPVKRKQMSKQAHVVKLKK